jgi:hypothetical protein
VEVFLPLLFEAYLRRDRFVGTSRSLLGSSLQPKRPQYVKKYIVYGVLIVSLGSIPWIAFWSRNQALFNENLVSFSLALPTFIVCVALLVLISAFLFLKRDQSPERRRVLVHLFWLLWILASLSFYIGWSAFVHIAIIDFTIDAPPFPPDSPEFYRRVWLRAYVDLYLLSLLLFTPPLVYLLRCFRTKGST